MSEYQELKAAGLTDRQIHMLRNMGASHAAILLYARGLLLNPVSKHIEPPDVK